MKYVSIIRFLKYCNIDYTTLDLSKMKKIIAAEYALSEGGIISIDGFDYTKDSVLQEIEREDFLQRLNYHVYIWSYKDLLGFLEQVRDVNTSASWFSSSMSADFKRFISPYFAYSFNKLMHSYLRESSLVEAGQWLIFLAFVDFVDENEALSSTRSFIAETLKLFRNTSKSNYKNHLSQLKVWAEQPIYQFINNLPDSMHDEAEDLAIALINFTVAIQHTNKRLCFAISENLTQLNTLSERDLNLIRTNHQIYKSNMKKTPFKRILKGVFIAFLLIKIIPLIIGGIIGMLGLSFCSEKKDRDTERGRFSAYSENRKKAHDAIYKITHEDFSGIIEEYTGMLQDTLLVLEKNKAIPLTKDLYFFMIEDRLQSDSTGVLVVNHSKQRLNYYISPSDDIDPMEFAIDAGFAFSMDVKHCCFNLMIATIDSSRTRNVTKEHVVPVLISDTLDLSPRIIQVDYKGKRTHIWNAEVSHEFIILFTDDSIFMHAKEGHKVGWAYKRP